jgi:hypothetical protein
MDSVSATAERKSSMQAFNIDSSVPPLGRTGTSVCPEKEKVQFSSNQWLEKRSLQVMRLMQNFSVQVMSART